MTDEQVSQHADMRGAQRNISHRYMELVLEYGRCLRASNAKHHFFGEREVERFLETLGSIVFRLEGILVIESQDGTVLTVYRNPKALKLVKRKMRLKGTSHRPAALRAA